MGLRGYAGIFVNLLSKKNNQIIIGTFPTSGMEPNKPLKGVLFSLVPGLGQVYCGQYTRGFLLCLGVFFSGLLSVLALLGYAGAISQAGIFLLLIPLALWIFAAYDADSLCRKMIAGKLAVFEQNALHMILFTAGAVILVSIGIAVTGAAVALLAFSAADGYAKMHDSPGVNVTIHAEKSGTTITLTNVDGSYSGLDGYDVSLNGVHLEKKLGAGTGDVLILNGTSGMDRVVVRGFWSYGASQTLLDTSV